MNKKDPLIFLRHILDAIGDIRESMKNLSKKEFEENKDVKDATVRRIEVIGEAVKNLPNSLKKKYKDVSWKEIVGTRDKMIHHYFGVDFDIVWDIVKEDLPELKKEITRILEEENKS